MSIYDISLYHASIKKVTQKNKFYLFGLLFQKQSIYNNNNILRDGEDGHLGRLITFRPPVRVWLPLLNKLIRLPIRTARSE